MTNLTLSPAEALSLGSLISPTPGGIASRMLAKTSGGNVTLFAFDAGQSLTEHRAPVDALVIVIEGSMLLVIGGKRVQAAAGTLVLLPANVPHAVEAQNPSRMMLIMLKVPKTA